MATWAYKLYWIEDWIKTIGNECITIVVTLQGKIYWTMLYPGLLLTFHYIVFHFFLFIHLNMAALSTIKNPEEFFLYLCKMFYDVGDPSSGTYVNIQYFILASKTGIPGRTNLKEYNPCQVLAFDACYSFLLT